MEGVKDQNIQGEAIESGLEIERSGNGELDDDKKSRTGIFVTKCFFFIIIIELSSFKVRKLRNHLIFLEI